MHSKTILPLHGGKAPRWLFNRMVKLGGEIATVVIDEYGSDEFLRRISNPMWFQALSCAIGYDWHSSGTTTVTMGALKEALNGSGEVYIAGGKGKQGLMTPEEITKGTDELNIAGEAERFKELSRLVAKVDSAMVYDRVGIYHHTFIFNRNRKWAVVQQAIDQETNYAVRFQWIDEQTDPEDITNEPHTGISTSLHKKTLDLTARSNKWVKEHIGEAIEEFERGSMLFPARHRIVPQIDMSRRAMEIIKNLNDMNIEDYKELLLVKGVGRATLRSLAFISSLIYDKELSYRDPVMYAYNLGGKDGIPFKIDRSVYDNTIKGMQQIIDEARMDRFEKLNAFRRLEKLSHGSGDQL
ncbi:MAG: DUF763 domain-containing protein [Candidatus Micrarchaeia archaeon]